MSKSAKLICGIAAALAVVLLGGSYDIKAHAAAPLTVQQWRMQEITFTSTKNHGNIQQDEVYSAGFEDGLMPGWSAYGGGDLSVADFGHDGNKSVCLTNRTGSWQSPAYNIYDILKENGAGTYTISCWVYVDQVEDTVQNKCWPRMGLRATEDYSFVQNGVFKELTGYITTPKAEWTQFSGTITVSEADLKSEKGDVRLVMENINQISGEAVQNLYMDDISITKEQKEQSFNDITLDVTFSGPDNTTMVVPAFWDGGNTWKVRFAPTKTGTWTYLTSCSDTTDGDLHNIMGRINCVPYTGNLDIYKKGFVRTQENEKYFVYDDGTPFFYIGDTHWGMPYEPYDEMFTTLVDDRVEKGFTVYQSEPLEVSYNLNDGLTDSDIEGFRDLDRRFEYIANAGLVHANAQLIWVMDLEKEIYTDEYIDQLARYWVARYSAYPVMWTTAQEIDQNQYGKFVGDQWKKVFEAIHKYDPYQHPQTAHQENTGSTTANNSAYKDLPGYTWFAAQWSPRKNGLVDFKIAREYWDTNIPAVMYEGHYENLWTNQFGARMQGWVAYLSGMFGYGYGTQDIWYYNNAFGKDTETQLFEITITKDMKNVSWTESKDFETSVQLGTYMRNFFESLEWWKLTPRFDDETWFDNGGTDKGETTTDGSWYTVATIDNDTYVVYFYNNKNQKTGQLRNMDDVPYTAQWYDPTSGQYEEIGVFTPQGGIWDIPDKPDHDDWVLCVSKQESDNNEGGDAEDKPGTDEGNEDGNEESKPGTDNGNVGGNDGNQSEIDNGSGETKQETSVNSPETGDKWNPLLPITAGIAATVLMVVMYVYRKKNLKI